MVTKTDTLNKRKWRNYGFVAALIAPAVIHLVVFWFAVNINSILMAFKDVNGQWSMGNFGIFFQEIFLPSSVLGQALKNTLIFFGVGIVIQLPLSLVFSYFLYKKVWLYKVFRVVFFFPSIISGVVMVSLYRYMINGPLTDFLFLFMDTVPHFLADSNYTLWFIVLFGIWTGFATNLVLFNGAMARIPEDIIEYSRLDGVGFFREMVQIVMPIIWPTVSTIVVLSFVGIFNASGPILLFTEGRFNTYTISYWVYERVTRSSNLEYAAAVGVIFTVVGLPIVMLSRFIMSKLGQDVEY